MPNYGLIIHGRPIISRSYSSLRGVNRDEKSSVWNTIPGHRLNHINLVLVGPNLQFRYCDRKTAVPANASHALRIPACGTQTIKKLLSIVT